jgi:hypothetical protein
MAEHTIKELDDKDREILLLAALGLSFDIRVFNERLNQEIERLRRNGVSEQSIIRTLESDLATKGRIFGELRNSIKRGTIGAINQAFRRFGDMGGKLRWVAISKNICPDCKERAGEIDTWDNWTVRGMPGSGFSVCKEYCYCQLLPVDVDVSDKLKL